MKIFKLEIENIRGIKKMLTLNPNNRNLVICGDNGTGKSAVVDAIDFLFTGNISRLTGPGSKGMSLKEHGPHVDTSPNDAYVKADIYFDNYDTPIPLSRTLSDPKKLVLPELEDTGIHKVIDIASKGQLVLSRAEILKFIAAEAGTRSDEIQSILNLNEVENIRKLLGTIDRDAKKTVKSSEVALVTSEENIKISLGLDNISEPEVLSEVNKRREVLKGEPLEGLVLTLIKDGISPQPNSGSHVDPEQLKRTLRDVKRTIESDANTILTSEKELRHEIARLHADEYLRKALISKKLIDLGVSLLDSSGECPLCLTKWEPMELTQFLEKRLEEAGKGKEIENRIIDKAAAIAVKVSSLGVMTSFLADAATTLKKENLASAFNAWKERLGAWKKGLETATENYPSDEVGEEYCTLMALGNWSQLLDELESAAILIGGITPEQQAWDTLTTVIPQLERYVSDKESLARDKKLSERATLLHASFIEIKDEVLGNLYNSVRDDFVEYYKFLHEKDEKAFYAELVSEGAGLTLNVDFFGRGAHHPRALHSEGHQDSMGLCLYLALYKKISDGKVKLVILDDVVMSIDSGHRRNICKLLMKYFPDYQFIITTHNRTWARQIKTQGVVDKDGVIEFKGWDVDTGPRYGTSDDVWDLIENKLNDNEVSAAAHALREHLEFFFEGICDGLHANIRYKSDGHWELGDYLNGAKSVLKNNIKKARNAATKWGQQDQIDSYAELETQFIEIVNRTQIEQWGINANVHYSKWDDFGKSDFQPIVEAFKDFEGLYRCSSCQGMIALHLKGTVPSSVKCPCGNITWNLETERIN